MPANSISLQQVAAIALHHPEKLYKRNRDILKMNEKELRKLAETKHAGLPKKRGNPYSHKKKTKVKHVKKGIKKIHIKKK